MNETGNSRRRRSLGWAGVAFGVIATLLIGGVAWRQAEVKDFETRRRECVDRLIELASSVNELDTEQKLNNWPGPKTSQEPGHPLAVAAVERTRRQWNRVLASCADPDIIPPDSRRLFDGRMRCDVLFAMVPLAPHLLTEENRDRTFGPPRAWALKSADDVRNLDAPPLLWWMKQARPADFAPDGVSVPS